MQELNIQVHLSKNLSVGNRGSLRYTHFSGTKVSSVKLHPLMAEWGTKVKHSHLVSPGNQTLHKVSAQKTTPTHHNTHFVLHVIL